MAVFTAVFLVVLFLFFGLRSKTWPSVNGASWMPVEKVLRFTPPGIAYVDDFSFSRIGSKFEEYTIHINVTPQIVSYLGFKPILLIHTGNDAKQLSVWHWGPSLIVMNGDDYDYTRKMPRIVGENVLRVGTQSFISVTSGSEGCKLFVNGVAVAGNKDMRLTLPETLGKRRLVFGNSVRGDQGWAGDIAVFGLYGRTFSADEVKEHYLAWKKKRVLPAKAVHKLQLLYNFYEFDGLRILEASGKGPSLILPAKPLVLQKKFLVLPWRDMEVNSFFILDVILNLFGFVILGVVLSHCFAQFTHPFSRYTPWLVILFCFLLSLTMEILQTSLPTRVSSLLDLFLNSLGGLLGVILYLYLAVISPNNREA